MAEAVAVADTIHALVAEPNATLAVVLVHLDEMRREHGDETVFAALTAELLTTSARLRTVRAQNGA